MNEPQDDAGAGLPLEANLPEVKYEFSLSQPRVSVKLVDRHPLYQASLWWAQDVPVTSEDQGEIRMQVALRLFAAAVAHLAPMSAPEAAQVLLERYQANEPTPEVDEQVWKAWVRSK